MTRTKDGIEWGARGLCREVGPDAFFPTAERGRDLVRQESEAKRVCAACPVLAQCRPWAIEHQEHGVAGGLGEQERRLMRLGLPADAGDAELQAAVVELVAEGMSVADAAELAGRTPQAVRPWCDVRAVSPGVPSRSPSVKSRTGELRARGLELLEGGRSPREVAEELGTAVRTVERWRAAA